MTSSSKASLPPSSSTSVVKLNAMSGCMDEGPPCHILEIDGFRFLLDCGWDEFLTMEPLHRLKKHVSRINCVLLSHSDVRHLGALPYLVGKYGLACPVYATVPVFKMGQMSLYDLYLNHYNNKDFSLFNLDDVDSAFDRIIQVEYSQTVQLKGTDLSITALPAGHILGGTIWKISKPSEEPIYYAIDHNTKKERHLNGVELLTNPMVRPTNHISVKAGIVITNAMNALYVQEKRRKCDDTLLEVMQRTLVAGGNVLVATDTCGRALEIILMIDQMWKMKGSKLSQYSLVFMNNVAFNVFDFARQLTEWMGDKLQKVAAEKTNPFQLKNVTLCHTLVELSQVPAPKVVVTSSADLECGFARDLFLQWCQDPLSSVVITSRSSPGTLGRSFVDGQISRGSKIDLEMRYKVKLDGAELQGHNNNNNNSFNSHHNNDPKSRGQQEGEDGDIQIVAADSPASPPSPVSRHKKIKLDDYGEVINPDEYRITEPYRHPSVTALSGGGRKTNGYSSPVKDPMREKPTSKDWNYTPTKSLRSAQSYSMNCQVIFIDFEGRSDVESQIKMIQDLNPKKLVLVGGSQDSTQALETIAKKLLPPSCTTLCPPGTNQPVDLTCSSSKIVQVKLTKEILASVEMKEVAGGGKSGNYAVGWLEGEVSMEERSQPDEMDEGDAIRFKLDTMTNPGGSSSMKKKKPLGVNKLKLTELRAALNNIGINCEISNGVIKCACQNGIVYVSKDSRSIHIECDGLPEEYYAIRSLLYDRIAML